VSVIDECSGCLVCVLGVGAASLLVNLNVQPVEHVLLLSCVVAYGVRCSIAGGRRERDFLLFPPF
jgi:hypothetical protein